MSNRVICSAVQFIQPGPPKPPANFGAKASANDASQWYTSTGIGAVGPQGGGAPAYQIELDKEEQTFYIALKLEGGKHGPWHCADKGRAVYWIPEEEGVQDGLVVPKEPRKSKAIGPSAEEVAAYGKGLGAKPDVDAMIAQASGKST